MSGLPIQSLGPLVRIRTGKLDANANDPGGAYPFFTCSRTPLRISSHSYNCECVLVAGNGDLNVKYYNGKFDAYQRTYIIESLDSHKLNVKYLFYFLSEYVEVLRRGSVGGVIKFIKLDHLTNASIPVPPLQEQERIVSLLDETNELRKLRAQTDRRTADLIPALFHEMFGDPEENPKGWPIEPLGKLCDFVGGESLPKGLAFNGQEGGYLLVKVGDMNSPGNNTHLDRSREWVASKVKRRFAPRGSVIIPKRGGAIATNKKRILLRDALLDPNIMGLHPNYRRVVLDYFFEWFRLFDLTTITSGSAVPQLNKYDLDPLKMAVPPLPLQEEFAQRVTEIRAMEAEQATNRQRLDDLFQSMLHRAFNGAL